MFIAIENRTASHLHVNPGPVARDQFDSPATWSVRSAGDFIIFVNNALALPVIVRHPQRFNDSRAFVTAFKREFIELLGELPVPHAKISMIRSHQFQEIEFTRQLSSAAQQKLQRYQNMLTGPNSPVDWEEQPTNAQLALQLAENTTLPDPQTGDSETVIERFEDYVAHNYQLPAHPQLNEHNRSYLYRSASLNDVMNATAVSELFLKDYQRYLTNRDKSDQIIDRDLNAAADYLSFCEGEGVSMLADLGLVYNYLLHYEELNDVQMSMSAMRNLGTALRELGRFMRNQQLFSSADFDQFVQSVGQGINDHYSHQRVYHLQRLLRNLQQQAEQQREAMDRGRHFRGDAYTLTVTLADYQPTMWRQLRVSGATRLDMLCYEILASFRANGGHLFELNDDDHHFQLPVFESGAGNEQDIELHWLGEYQPGDELTLIYDFGDSWMFEIKVESVQKQSRLRNAGMSGAVVLDGAGAGIIDDIGGTAGLQEAASDDPSINRTPNFAQEQEEWRRRVEQLQEIYN